ncbi:MAG: DUF192 domain-containing protein [Ilumatobacteraceae bacterium]|nr:DUF192 domain-containing protein [Ilumatobacteraceae bacterium]
MAWLMCGARVLASADVAHSRHERRRGLLGRDGIDGALIIEPCRWIHTIGMRFPIDVAYLDDDGIVIKTVQMRRHRLAAPVTRAHMVVEAEAGAFARWGLGVGDQLEVRTDGESDTMPEPDEDQP